MSRIKKGSKVLVKARQRATGLRSISPELSFDEGLTLLIFESLISDGEETEKKYNELLSVLDGMHAEMMMKEIKIRDMSERMLNAAAGKYGNDSAEYEKAGGKRKSERKRPKRKVKAA